MLWLPIIAFLFVAGLWRTVAALIGLTLATCALFAGMLGIGLAIITLILVTETLIKGDRVFENREDVPDETPRSGI